MKRIGTRSLTLALGAAASLLAAIPALAQTSTSSDAAGATIGIVMLICGLLMFVVVMAFYIWVAVWIYKDATKRGAPGALWALLWIILGVLGLIVYLVVRPRDFVGQGGSAVPPPPVNETPPPPPAESGQ